MSIAKLPFAFHFQNSDFVTLTEAEEDEDFVPVLMMAFYLEATQEQMLFIDNGEWLDRIGFYEFIGKNESEYGVHDVGFSEPWFFGYNSYEVELERQKECANNIRAFFIGKGVQCSEIQTFQNTLDDESGEVFEKEFVEQPGVYDIWNNKFVIEPADQSLRG